MTYTDGQPISEELLTNALLQAREHLSALGFSLGADKEEIIQNLQLKENANREIANISLQLLKLYKYQGLTNIEAEWKLHTICNVASSSNGHTKPKTLAEEILPIAQHAGLKLNLSDTLLCARIEQCAKSISKHEISGISRLNTAFESEFFICKGEVPNIRKLPSTGNLDVETFCKSMNKATYQSLGCEITSENPDGSCHGSLHKLEARTIFDKKWPDTIEGLKKYFLFRSALQQDIKQRFPEYKYHRYSEHLNFSFANSDGTQVKDSQLDPRFRKLLEASLRCHWHAAFPLIDNIERRNIRKDCTSASLNLVGEDSDMDYYFCIREAKKTNSNITIPDVNRYEIRRTMPGPDRPKRHLPSNPMIAAQALLSASVNFAMEAYKNQETEALLKTQLDALETSPATQKPADLRASPILNHPASLGAEATMSLFYALKHHQRNRAGATISG